MTNQKWLSCVECPPLFHKKTKKLKSLAIWSAVRKWAGSQTIRSNWLKMQVFSQKVSKTPKCQSFQTKSRHHHQLKEKLACQLLSELSLLERHFSKTRWQGRARLGKKLRPKRSKEIVTYQQTLLKSFKSKALEARMITERIGWLS